MRLLIDGYNVMFAQGLVGKRYGIDHFRKARTHFLNKLADAAGPRGNAADHGGVPTPPRLPMTSPAIASQGHDDPLRGQR